MGDVVNINNESTNNEEEIIKETKQKIEVWKTYAISLQLTLFVAIGILIYDHHEYVEANKMFAKIYNTGVVYQKDENVNDAFRKWYNHQDYANVLYSDNGELNVFNPILTEINKPRIIYDSIISPGYYICSGSLYVDTIMTIQETDNKDIVDITFDMYNADDGMIKKFTYQYQVALSETKNSGISSDGNLIIRIASGRFEVVLLDNIEDLPSWMHFDGYYRKIMDFTEGEI